MILLVLIILATTALWISRNHTRRNAMSKFPVKEARLQPVNERDESYFRTYVYNISRDYGNNKANLLNRLFRDQLLVVKIPLKNYRFRNVIFEPVGNDTFSPDAAIIFNTVFFLKDFSPSTGMKSDGEKINEMVPGKSLLGINSEGEMMLFQKGRENRFPTILQLPYKFGRDVKVHKTYRCLNFFPFLSIKDGHLFYISGKGNSLVCWADVRQVMQAHGLEFVYPLDGGNSLEYKFKGKHKTYHFSSIPLRKLWFRKNSPFYLEGRIR